MPQGALLFRTFAPDNLNAGLTAVSITQHNSTNFTHLLDFLLGRGSYITKHKEIIWGAFLERTLFLIRHLLHPPP